MAAQRAVPSNIAPLARLGGMLAARGTLFMVQQNAKLMDSLAQQLFESEERGEWAQLPTSTRALWTQRVRTVLQCLSDAAK